ncbi:unnamed protein product [Prorocentrum cordatum]|uniref:KHDC4/BBP-like KH-domain type I domain-containing protein n=1 Tax=Prorocentrum cordatum TaxID=2364126 RepID=A0ABN9SYY3_9DINO|nr:unnamed protein product [Polarella glacialis]
MWRTARPWTAARGGGAATAAADGWSSAALPPTERPRRDRGTHHLQRLWCYFHIENMAVPGFDLVPIIIGLRGCNTRRIAELTGAKVRVRGKGSRHLEPVTGKEAPVPLSLVVTCFGSQPDNFLEACVQATMLLRHVEQRYFDWRSQCGAAHAETEEAFTLELKCRETWEGLRARLGDQAPACYRRCLTR